MDRPLLFIGGEPAEVTYAGLTGSGLNQLNIVVPPLTPGDHAVEAQAGGLPTQGGMFLCIGGGLSELRIDKTELVFQGNGPPLETQAVNVSSSAGTLSFRARARTESGRSWLRAPDGGITAAELPISVLREGLAPGIHRGSIVVGSCADASGPKTVGVRLEIPAPPPSFTGLNPGRGNRGASFTLRITGQNLSGASRVDFSPPDGIEVTNLRGSATELQADVKITADATLGIRKVALTTPSGKSGELEFEIAQFKGPPELSNLRVNRRTEGREFVVEYEAEFSDPDGDMSVTPIRTLSCSGATGGAVISTVFGTTTSQGLFSGTVRFVQRGQTALVVTPPIRHSMSVVDAAGNRSNTVSITITTGNWCL